MGKYVVTHELIRIVNPNGVKMELLGLMTGF